MYGHAFDTRKSRFGPIFFALVTVLIVFGLCGIIS